MANRQYYDSEEYYHSELYYLRKMGKVFRDEHPHLRNQKLFLEQPGEDPDVERLLEGFAFLTGAIRQKLDDEYPELTQGLFRMLMPNYLQPVPAMSILELIPRSTIRERTPINRKAQVASADKGHGQFLFRTCYPVDLYPLSLIDAKLGQNGERLRLSLDFRTLPLAEHDKLDIKSLRIFLHSNNPQLNRTLYYWLCQCVGAIAIGYEESGRWQEANLKNSKILPVGFDEDEAVLPYPKNAFFGYRILQEYFVFPEKFLFVDVKDVGMIPSGVVNFSLLLDMDIPISEKVNVTKENFRLYCTPVINVFSCFGQPIRLDGKKKEHLVRPLLDNESRYQVYSIQSVKSTRGDLEYKPYATKFTGESSSGLVNDPTYQVHLRLRNGHVDNYIRFTLEHNTDDPHIEKLGKPNKGESAQDRVVSLELLCMNHHLSNQIELGDIHEPTDDSPHNLADFRNITPVTRSLAPPLEKDLDWRLLSNLTLNYGSLNLQALRTILSAYDTAAVYDDTAKQRSKILLESIVEVSTNSEENMSRGLPVRGLRTTIKINNRHFYGEGDVYLFGSVLNAFFAMYAHVNSYHRTTLVVDETRKEYTWEPMTGMQPLL
jgi:type VI secretion system protein ImpG